MNRRVVRRLLSACITTGLSLGAGFLSPGGGSLGPSPARAQINAPAPSAPTQPSGGGQALPKPGSADSAGTTTPPASPPTMPPNQAPAGGPTVQPSPDKSLAPGGPPENTEIERNGSPGIPGNATTEEVDVPARAIALLKGQSSYDDAFKSIKASIESVKAAMDKAGLKPSGHPITVFSEPDDKGFKFQAAIPMAAIPMAADPTKTDATKTDLSGGVTIGSSPSGKAIKFQHRGAYDDIDSTYDVITAYLDAKGMQVDNPYIEEYLTDLTTADDPNLQIDIYVFVKK